jgi:arylsulfatase A
LGSDLKHPNRMGFEQYSLFGWHEGARYHQPLIWENGKRRDGVTELYGPDVYCEFLIDFMKTNRKRPFFAYFPMALCHDVTDDLDKPVPYGPRGRYDSFAEMAAEMDRIVGKLVGAIDDLGLRKKTVILFTGDNGTPFRSTIRVEGNKYIRDPVYSIYKGQRVQGGKTKLTNGGTNVPLIASWPGVIEPGGVVDDLVDFSDFLPTLAELTGAKLPVGVTLDGKSFAGRLIDDKPAARTWAYAEAPRNKYWVRTQRWKLYNNGRWFDMQNDTVEKMPLKGEQLPTSADDAKRLLTAAMKQVGDFQAD